MSLRDRQAINETADFEQVLSEAAALLGADRDRLRAVAVRLASVSVFSPKEAVRQVLAAVLTTADPDT